MVIKQYDVFLLSLDPAIGQEIKKIRPRVIIYPNEMNEHLATVMIVPMTKKSPLYPTRVSVNFNDRNGWIVLDQIRTVDKKRLVKKLGTIDLEAIKNIKSIIKETLVD